jgi:hypothetical protein
MKRPLEVRDVSGGSLQFLLWIILVVSFVAMILQPWHAELERAEDYRKSLPGVGERVDARERESLYLKKLARAVNPQGLAPATFTLAAGFLTILRALRVSTAVTVAAMQAQPEQTAAAFRAAARSVKQETARE